MRQLFNELKKANLVLVGHNLIYDILFTYQAF